MFRTLSLPAAALAALGLMVGSLAAAVPGARGDPGIVVQVASHAASMLVLQAEPKKGPPAKPAKPAKPENDPAKPAKPAPPGAKKEPPLPGPFHFPPKITLTAQQQQQVEAIAKEYLPRVKALDEARDQIYTPEQREARKAARERAHAAGLRGKEAAEQVEKSVTLSADQKTRLAEVEAQRKALHEEIHAKMAAVLTAEQREALGGKYASKPKEKKPEAPEKKPEKKPGPPEKKPGPPVKQPK